MDGNALLVVLGGGDRRLPVKIYVFNLTLNDQLSSDIRGREEGLAKGNDDGRVGADSTKQN